MPSYPPAVATVTVTGTYRWADAQAIAPIGAVSFIPSETLQDATDNVILSPVAVVCPLVDQGDGSSKFTTTLMATDDTDLQPTGWVYQVKESLGGTIREYNAQFPAAGTPYDLADISPALPDPLFSYILTSQRGIANGVATLDSGALVPAAQLPFAAPTGQSRGAGATGSASSVNHSDHAHPFDLWTHLDHGVGAWTFDPGVVAGQTQTTPVAGTVYLAKLIVPAALAGVTSIWMHAITAGSVLTSGQCFAALFSGAGALLQVTADQSGVWNSGGLKQMAITSQAVAAGTCYVGWFFNGTTGPRWHGGGNGVGAVNFGLSAANSRFATDSTNTGRTTTMPATLGTLAASSNALWAAIS